MANIKAAKGFLQQLKDGAYAWPGGYPMFFITADGAVISFRAAQEEKAQIVDSLLHGQRQSGWYVEGRDINWENASLHCDHTGERIESAYAEDEAQS